MKKYTLLLFLFVCVSGYAQNTINNYKYVVVPEKFSFLKQPNQYRLNELAKSLLEDKGFTVYIDDSSLPTEIANNRCGSLILDALEKKGMFTTNITVLLKDCQGNVLFKSKEGKSREKEYNVSYNLALRDAFTSLNDVQYAYNGTTSAQGQQLAITPVVTSPTKPSATATAVDATQPLGTLYAQPTANGYQLIDTAPKIILTLLKTSNEDFFIANNGSSNGIVFKKNENWFYEYYKNDKLTSEKLLIKF